MAKSADKVRKCVLSSCANGYDSAGAARKLAPFCLIEQTGSKVEKGTRKKLDEIIVKNA
jgi:hypothetical protein